MAADFLSALVAAAAADATLAAAGLGTWHYGTAPDAPYPHLVITSLGTKITNRNYGKCKIHEDHLRINVFADDADEADTLGKLARTFLESIQAAPLAFDDGRQTDFHQTGEDLVNLRRPGPGGLPFVWVKSITLVAKIARDRA